MSDNLALSANYHITARFVLFKDSETTNVVCTNVRTDKSISTDARAEGNARLLNLRHSRSDIGALPTPLSISQWRIRQPKNGSWPI
jgi:hypothetical protein